MLMAGAVGGVSFQSFRWKPSKKQSTSQLQLHLAFVSDSPGLGIAQYKGLLLSSLLWAKGSSTQLEPPEKHTEVLPDLSEREIQTS